jgi:hypothetical protein
LTGTTTTAAAKNHASSSTRRSPSTSPVRRGSSFRGRGRSRDRDSEDNRRSPSPSPHRNSKKRAAEEELEELKKQIKFLSSAFGELQKNKEMGEDCHSEDFILNRR